MENINLDIEHNSIVIISDYLETDQYGAIHLPIDGNDLLRVGITYSDIIKVTSPSFKKGFLIPVVFDYNYIDNGTTALAFSNFDSKVLLLSTGGQFVHFSGLGSVNRNSDGSPYLKLFDNISYPITINISLHEKEGYKKTYEVYKFLFESRSNSRDYYPYLSDENFANFRNIFYGDIKKGILFRGSSPISDKFNRNSYADNACKLHGIKTIINLTDSSFDIAKYKAKGSYIGTYYESLKDNVLLLGLPADYWCKEFSDGIVKAIRFINSHETPILIHCLEGKDRTGFFSAVLEALMGATAQEIYNDYILTFVYYFVINPKDEYASFVGPRIFDYLSTAFKQDILTSKDLSGLARNYLHNIGLDYEEINQLVKVLKGE